MQTLARACGVSSMTVSRALRMPGAPGPTQRRIRAVAERMGYQVNGRMGRPRRAAAAAPPPVEIIIGTAIGGGNLYHARLVVAIERALSRQGRDCLIRTCDAAYDRFLAVCEAVRRTRPDRMIILGYVPLDRLRSLVNLAPRPLLVDQSGNGHLAGDYDSIGFDNAAAVRLAVGHLLERGRRRILLLTGPADHYFSIDIERGYRDLLGARGLPVEASLIRAADFTAEGARRAVGELLADGLSFDAVFTNDEMAVGVLRALHEAGVAVPGRVAVAGCDGLPVGEHTIPTLTTVALNAQQLGRMAVEHLLARDGDARPACRILLVPRLVVRESSGAPEAGRRQAVSSVRDRRSPPRRNAGPVSSTS